jgi:hypothetical protein
VSDSPSRRLPPGSEYIARLATSRGGRYEAFPDDAWFRAWEPYDTIAPPSVYYNAVTWNAPPGIVVVAEPWSAPEDGEPIDRTLLAFATHPGLGRRASMRVGEHFLTRVAFLENAPPPAVKIGDALWDAHVATFASSPLEAAAAFPVPLRRLLAGWGFQGHLEMRPGGLVVHYAGLLPLPDRYERLLHIAMEIVNAAIAYPSYPRR